MPLAIEHVPLATLILWDKNPKKHDIGAIARSIDRYGFRDAPIYDATLGAVVAGNGRAETLAFMKRQGAPVPDGIAVGPDGDWLVPVQVGLDAASPVEAEAFAVDHNNVTLLGGDLTLFELARLWDDSYATLLASLAEHDALPVSVDREDLDALLAATRFAPLPDLDEGQHENALAILIRIGHTDALDAAAEAVRALVDEHPEWEAQVVSR